MSKGKIYLLVVLSLAVAATSMAKESSIRVQNTVRVGYDDNVYQSSSTAEEDTAFISDIVNVSGKLTFSSRTDMLLYWQPEFRYRLDADPKLLTYQDLYARLNHAVSQRTFLQLSDRLRYREKEGQGKGIDTSNQNYLENELMGSLDYTLDSVSRARLGAAHELRVWDDEDYGQGTNQNDYVQIRADGSFFRELSPNKTTGSLGVSYAGHSYDGSRGGYDSITAYAGIDQNFTPDVDVHAQLGYSFSSIDGDSTLGGADSDSSTPYAQASLEINPTARTSLSGSLGYSVYRSQNSFYNAQDRFSMSFGLRHDLTGKISVSTSVDYIHSEYDSAYARDDRPDDASDDFFKFNLRGSYQINRNNFVDAGYHFSTRVSDSALLSEFDRNRIDIGWRLRL